MSLKVTKTDSLPRNREGGNFKPINDSPSHDIGNDRFTIFWQTGDLFSGELL